MRHGATIAQVVLGAATALFGAALSRAEAGERLPPRLFRDTVASKFLYPLASWTGALTTSSAPVSFDPVAHETFVVSLQDSTVHVFNDRGMETYAFGDDAALEGSITSIAALPDGDLVAIVQRSSGTVVARCNFRGELKKTIELIGLSSVISKAFVPSKVIVQGDDVHLVDLAGMTVVTADASGTVKNVVRLAELMTMSASDQASDQIFDLHVDAAGTIYFTIPTLFRVYVLSADGKLESFGSKGSSPGLFNVISGISADDDGNIYVTDILRSVVMVFDRDQNFRGEFGYRGPEIDNLVAPRTIAVGDGKVFASQSAGRGVSVFGVRLLPPRTDGENERPRVTEETQ